MNELIFFGYIFTIASAILVALKLGKEGLISIICAQFILINLFATKQIILFGFTATASDALAVGITLSLNLLQEYYQKPAAIKAIWIAFFCSVFDAIISTFHLAYYPAPLDKTSILFQELFSPMPRLVIASLTTYLIVQYIDATLYGILKARLHKRYFIIRNYSTLAFTRFLDTLLFSFLGLYGISESFSNLGTLFEIIMISYMIKLIVILITVPYVRLARTLRIIG